MNFNYDKFSEKLKVLTQDTFIKCLQKLDPRDIAGFALYSDNSAMSISVSLNTFKNLQESIEDEPGHDIYFKWTPGEWEYEMINHESFKEINKMLSDAHFDEDNSNFLLHRNKIFDLAVDVLLSIKEKNSFDKLSEQFVLMFGVSDFSEPDLEKSYVSKLNSQSLSEEFSYWLETES